MREQINKIMETFQETIRKDGYKKGIKSNVTWKVLKLTVQTLLESDFNDNEILMLLVALYEAVAGEYR
jgi:hypothetical protein